MPSDAIYVTNCEWLIELLWGLWESLILNIANIVPKLQDVDFFFTKPFIVVIGSKIRVYTHFSVFTGFYGKTYDLVGNNMPQEVTWPIM